MLCFAWIDTNVILRKFSFVIQKFVVSLQNDF